MTTLLTSVGFILLSWAALGVVFAGVGALVLSAMVRGRWWGGFEAFWVGWAAVIVFLQLWHLVLPVNGAAAAMVAVAGALGLVRARMRWKRGAAFLRARPAFALLAVLAAVWLGGGAMGPPLFHDTGLYHLNSIRWAATYPIVPGLGNLHGRLAFNQTFFLYAALLDVTFWRGRVHHVAGGLPMLVTLWRLLGSVTLGRSGARRAFSAALLVGMVVLCREPDPSNLSPNTAVYVLGVALALWLFDWLRARGVCRDRGRLFVVALVACVGVTVKLSVLAFALAVVAVAAAVWVRRETDPDARWRGVGVLVGVAVVVLAPWVARGYVLSGYPAYPCAVGAAPFEWGVPRAVAQTETAWIKSWARCPGVPPEKVLADRRWLGPWLRDTTKRLWVAFPLALALVSLCVAGVGVLTKPRRATPSALWLLLIPPTAWLAFWFVMAPAVAFAGSAFWMLAAATMALAWPGVARWRVGLRRGGWAFAALTVAWLLVGGKAACARRLAAGEGSGPALNHLFVNSQVFMGHRPYTRLVPAPSPEVERVVTDAGLTVYVPVEGDLCWDAPLPCAPRAPRALRLRSPGDLGSGFILGPPDARR